MTVREGRRASGRIWCRKIVSSPGGMRRASRWPNQARGSPVDSTTDGALEAEGLDPRAAPPEHPVARRRLLAELGQEELGHPPGAAHPEPAAVEHDALARELRSGIGCLGGRLCEVGHGRVGTWPAGLASSRSSGSASSLAGSRSPRQNTSAEAIAPTISPRTPPSRPHGVDQRPAERERDGRGIEVPDEDPARQAARAQPRAEDEDGVQDEVVDREELDDAVVLGERRLVHEPQEGRGEERDDEARSRRRPAR